MRILLISDPYIAVPPKGYGGIERIVELLAIEFIKQGHEVSLLAGPQSFVEGATIHIFGKNEFPPSKKTRISAMLSVWKFLFVRSSKKYDIVINFGRLIYLLPWLNKKIKKVSCYQREISPSNVRLIFRFPHKNIVISGCSNDLIQRSGVASLCTYVYNCVDFSKYTLTENFNAVHPLFFLGRIERIKGLHIAIEVAKRTNNQLIIAGNISPLPEEKAYYENEIKPLIDGNQIIYIGQANDQQKNELIGRSKAMLFPIEWSEPFGIVMIESMACGTPVVAYNRGSVEEVIDEGITGFKVNTIDEMCQAVEKLSRLDRTNCRKKAEDRFSVIKIADQYLNLF